MRRIRLIILAFLVVFPSSSAVRHSLSAHSPLRCCFMDEPPISFQNNRSYWNNGLDGVIKEYLLQHQAYLNWTCSEMRLFDHANSTDFTFFVSEMERCTNISTGSIVDLPDCWCDIGIGGWFHTSARFNKVDFLPPFAYDRYVVFTHVSEATVHGNVWFFMRTFDGLAWINILAVFVMFWILKLFDLRFALSGPYQPLENASKLKRYTHYLTKSKILYRLRKAFQSTVMRMMMLSDEDIGVNGRSTRQWLLNLLVALVALFLLISYDASMTATLVQESIKSKFETVADLLNCNVKPSEICILRGGALEIFWQNSIAVDECHFQNPPKLYDSYNSLFKAVANRECKYAVMIETALMAATRMKYCRRFVIVGKPLFNNGLSMLLPKGSDMTDKMSQATLDLMGNQTQTYLDKYMSNLPRCRVDSGQTLSFNKLHGFFVLVYIVVGTLLLAMIFIPQQTSKGIECQESPASALSNEVKQVSEECSKHSPCSETNAAEDTI